jgi:hypothetical protein
MAEPDRVHELSFAAFLAGLALAFGALVAKKGQAFGRACVSRGGRAVGLLLLPLYARAVAAGLAFSAGVALELFDHETAGGALVGLAMLATVVRCPDRTPIARGPGRWLVLRPDDAFISSRLGHWLDVDCRAGQIGAFAATVVVAGAALAAGHLAPRWSWLVAFDAAALVPIFVTGRSSQLPPHGATSGAPLLARAFRTLKRFQQLRVVPWARVVSDGSTADELRLLLLPRAAMPGLIGIEIGLAWHPTPVGWVATPEVLVRVLDSSPAAAKLTRLVPGSRSLPGRRADERVRLFVAERSGIANAAALGLALANTLTDRRAEHPAETWTAMERRVSHRPPTVETAPVTTAREAQETILAAAAS